MKRGTTLSLVFTLSVLLLLISSPSTLQGQQPQSFSASSGVVTVGEGQTLRVTAAACAIGCIEELMELCFAWKQYGADSCSGSPQVCRHTVVAQGVTPREVLGPSGALSFNFQGPGAVNVTVRSNSRNARVTAMILDDTGKASVVWDILEE